jgi:uncharacterized membrane protein
MIHPRPSRTVLPLLVLLVQLTSCASESVSCDRDPPLTYENFGEAFLTRNCTGCHSTLMTGDERNGAPVGCDFNTYAGVLDWADRIEARGVPDDGGMPPGGGVAEADRLKLQEWIGCDVAADLAAAAEKSQGVIR